jgi:hypothetical protein
MKPPAKGPAFFAEEPGEEPGHDNPNGTDANAITPETFSVMQTIAPVDRQAIRDVTYQSGFSQTVTAGNNPQPTHPSLTTEPSVKEQAETLGGGSRKRIAHVPAGFTPINPHMKGRSIQLNIRATEAVNRRLRQVCYEQRLTLPDFLEEALNLMEEKYPARRH